MPTITLQVNDNVYEKFQWLLSHFHKDEIDIMHPSKEEFDYISDEKMQELKNISNNYKSGKKDEFVEYKL
ncbi:MAG: hypothetical protein KU38_10270 [Sulfurovum sp. FS08-3]|nr:MAG: hypothetical protein KU38_10270 [Sulfurovum sp. FS08-3]